MNDDGDMIVGEYQTKVGDIREECSEAFKEVPDDVVVSVATGNTFDLKSV